MVQINMSIPESCAFCPLSVRLFGKLYCPYLDGMVGNEGKDSRCPLVDADDQFAEVSKKVSYAQPEIINIAKATMAMAKKADLVAVTRCKDCKHYYYADNRIPQEQRFVCDLEGERWKPDDYCSFAERRTDV